MGKPFEIQRCRNFYIPTSFFSFIYDKKKCWVTKNTILTTNNFEEKKSDNIDLLINENLGRKKTCITRNLAKKGVANNISLVEE